MLTRRNVFTTLAAVLGGSQYFGHSTSKEPEVLNVHNDPLRCHPGEILQREIDILGSGWYQKVLEPRPEWPDLKVFYRCSPTFEKKMLETYVFGNPPPDWSDILDPTKKISPRYRFVQPVLSRPFYSDGTETEYTCILEHAMDRPRYTVKLQYCGTEASQDTDSTSLVRLGYPVDGKVQGVIG